MHVSVAAYDRRTMPDLDVERPSGRRVRVRHDGRRGDPLVVYFHGSPSSRLDIAFARGRSDRLGLHLAAFDRPGYGGSDFDRFTLSSVADDAVAVARALGYDRFAVLGFSSGAAAAAATAALHADHVTALGIAGGGAPFPEVPEELAGLSDGERRALDLVSCDEDEAERLLAEPDRVFLDVLAENDAAVLELWRSISPPADRRLLVDAGFAELVTATHRESLRQGQAGWARDNVVRMPRWNVDLSTITAPARFWYGEQDVVANGAWLKTQIPHAELLVLPGHGHLSVLYRQWDALVSALVPEDRRTQIHYRRVERRDPQGEGRVPDGRDD
jgi:pimeloyl-ACP methyl ester carboxylesterase